jgi:ferredoxin
MANRNDKNEGNAPGQFYVDTTCIDCDMCRGIAPQTFRRNEEIGFTIAYQQPATDDERKEAIEAAENCPTNSIGCDG